MDTDLTSVINGGVRMGQDKYVLSKYTLGIRILHWLVFVMALGMLVSGFLSSSLPPENKGSVILFHKSLGITVFGVMLVRLLVRATSRSPDALAYVPKLLRWASGLGHAALYVVLLALPITGYAMGAVKGYPVFWFGIQIPPLLPEIPDWSEPLYNAHVALVYTFIALLSVHILATLFHWVVFRSNIFKRVV